jgi:large subunit ribosomal protein L18
VATDKVLGRQKRKLRIRKRVNGTTDRPRLSVFRSARHIYVQVIDDTTGSTLASASTLTKDLKGSLEGKSKKEQAREIGLAIAKQCLNKSIDKVTFDRNGYIYHGRVAEIADGAREGGLSF